jgi:succinate dehydrogenase flavin-adding protein (antitoxin of CptAB toxin-antitoxin module)
VVNLIQRITTEVEQKLMAMINGTFQPKTKLDEEMMAEIQDAMEKGYIIEIPHEFV